MAENQYTSISVHIDDDAFYDEIRQEVSADLGVKMSKAQVIKLGMTFYNQRRKLGMAELAERPSDDQAG